MSTLIYKYKMASHNIKDINLEILSWITNFKLFINLSTLGKKSYILITNTLIYTELDILKTNNTKLNDDNIINQYYKLGLVNILKKLKKIMNDSFHNLAIQIY